MNGGYGPALNWYRAALHNVNEADDKGSTCNASLKQSLSLLA